MKDIQHITIGENIIAETVPAKELQEPIKCRHESQIITACNPVIDENDMIVFLCILCGTLINALLIITGFWYCDTLSQYIIVSAFTTLGFTCITVWFVKKILNWAKRKSLQ